MQTIKITTSQNIDIDYEVAGLGERIVARLIDMGILIVLFLLGLFLGIMAGVYSNSETIVIIAYVTFLVILVFYDLGFEIFMNGQSIGKRIMKIRVISLNGSQPNVGQYVLRWLFRIVDFGIEPGLVALVVAAISEKPQRLGDIVAGTMLIRTVPRTKMNNIVFMPMYDGYQPVFPVAAQLNDRDIELIHEVINSYQKTGNNVVVYNMAQRVKEHLNVEPPQGMNDMLFLQTIIKDYSHISAQADTM
ncbi:RDD family protein [Mucilaginibacter ginsenosidivorans]|uniref:RDD family protein n=1 Tax=Mucilaginibacter ginsenosidivorans TaxID=398053 RepID=A0A5B8URQ0_9SPHI|nr:RDD family protein [Mucilaginibacter ginsenosidivorans]QEC61071.1 RDD family protein [Mucilaginibacter ginsenosidivorans]